MSGRKLSRQEEVLIALLVSIPVICVLFSFSDLSLNVLFCFAAVVCVFLGVVYLRRKKDKKQSRSPR